jgi:hypothetical protein
MPMPPTSPPRIREGDPAAAGAKRPICDSTSSPTRSATAEPRQRQGKRPPTAEQGQGDGADDGAGAGR